MRRANIAQRALLLALALLSGCASLPERVPFSAEAQLTAQVPDFVDVRLWTDAPLTEWQVWRDKWLAERTRQGVAAPIAQLAISSGSDEGAFSAGYLAGWSERGDRPEFSIVSGVSTGALIAPFAFLGSGYDPILRYLYTGIDADDIHSSKPLGVLFGAPSVSDTKPLKRLIDAHVTAELLDRIAAQHARGRRLLVMTTNLDAQRGVVWDMGAIASSVSPQRLALFRHIMLASASIPGIFPPVFIDASSGTKRFREMHVDGGTTSSLFVLPPAVLWGGDDAAPPEVTAGSSITMLYNGPLQPRFEIVEPGALTIMARALNTVISEADRQNILAYQKFAKAHGVQLKIITIGESFEVKNDSLFDPAYMKSLYEHGHRMASATSTEGDPRRTGTR